MKVITNRDLEVVRCLLALLPDSAGMTIRYVSLPDVASAWVKVQGLSNSMDNEINVILDKENDRWTAVKVFDPPREGNEMGMWYVVVQDGDTLHLKKEFSYA